MTEHEQDDHGVVVIGGGAAGLTGALVLARSRRSVVVGGQPRNAPAHGVHGFPTRDGIAPGELVRTGRREAEGYPAAQVDADLVAEDTRLAVEQARRAAASTDGLADASVLRVAPPASAR